MGEGRKGQRRAMSSPPPLRTTQARWSVGEFLMVKREREQFHHVLLDILSLSLFVSPLICLLHLCVSQLQCDPSALFMAIEAAKSVNLTAALPWSSLWCLKSFNGWFY